MGYSKIITAITAVFFTITVGYGQGQHNKSLTGSNNIAQAIKSSLSAVPYLKAGNVSCTISKYATSTETPANTRFYVEGQVTVDYFDITMPDGKSIRFTKNGENFTCSSNDFPPAADGTRRSRSFAPYAYVKYSGKTEIGSVSDNAEHHINFTGKTFKHIWGSQAHNNNISPIQSIQINCSGIVSYTLDDLKKRVNSLREEYDLLKKSNVAKNNKTPAAQKKQYDAFGNPIATNSNETNKKYDAFGNPIASNTKTTNKTQYDAFGNPVKNKVTTKPEPEKHNTVLENKTNAAVEKATESTNRNSEKIRVIGNINEIREGEIYNSWQFYYKVIKLVSTYPNGIGIGGTFKVIKLYRDCDSRGNCRLTMYDGRNSSDNISFINYNDEYVADWTTTTKEEKDFVENFLKRIVDNGNIFYYDDGEYFTKYQELIKMHHDQREKIIEEFKESRNK